MNGSAICVLVLSVRLCRCKAATPLPDIGGKSPTTGNSARQAARAGLQFFQKLRNGRRWLAAPERTQHDWREARQGKRADFWGHFCLGNRHRQTYPKTIGHISFDDIRRRHFNGREPLDSQPADALLKILADGFSCRKADERLVDFFTTPKIRRTRERFAQAPPIPAAAPARPWNANRRDRK